MMSEKVTVSELDDMSMKEPKLIPEKLDMENKNWTNYHVAKGSWLYQRLKQLNSITGCISYDTPEKGIIRDMWHSVSGAVDNGEWPKVGDDAIVDWGDYSPVYGIRLQDKKVKITSLFNDDGVAMAAAKFETVNYCIVVDALKKPPTPEEDLAEKLRDASNWILQKGHAAELSELIVGGKIEGLTYKQD